MTRPYRFGPSIEDDQVRFRLWAPDAQEVTVELQSGASARLEDGPDGWKDAALPCAAGARYRYRIGEVTFPDPASRRQSGGVHGWSVVCAEHRPPPTPWRGRPWNEAVIYELHAGLLGGFLGVCDRLKALAELGFTAIELMPIAAFPGRRNWGYDGVLPFAPTEAYGPPEHLRELIARAHDLGLMMLLDVVYNHFGPDGNYLPLYAKRFFRDDIDTPWGAAIDFRQPAVRTFFSENARYWLEEFGFDGLRFDAVHAIRDEGWLPELSADLRRSSPGRQIHLILENEKNDATLLREGYDAQWNDDLHHCLHVILTGEQKSYYADFADAPAAKLARAFAEGFVYQGEPSPCHGGAARGTPSTDLAPTSFVSFLQNHDQIGNRAFGERLTTLADPDALKAAVALLLLSPQIPLIFMGEEAGSRAPFLYFTDHDEKLARAVREGRQKEFGALIEASADLPDPNAYATFEASDPFGDVPDCDTWLRLFGDLLTLRRSRLVPHLEGAHSLQACAVGPKAVKAAWRLGDASTLTLASNLGDVPVTTELPAAAPVWGRADRNTLAAFTTIAWITRE